MKHNSLQCKIVLLTIVMLFLPSVVLASDAALLREVPISKEYATLAQKRPFILTAGKRQWLIPASQVKMWFKTRTSGDVTMLQLRPGAIYDYLNVKVSPKVNAPGTMSRFSRANGQIHLIAGGTKGTIVDGVKTSLAIRDALIANKSSVKVAMKEYRPEIFSAEDFKKYSFPDLLVHAETSFAGSPAHRTHNINVATKRFDGLVILPGQEYSFNQYLGAVDEANGYLPELVIKENVTTPELGGGICQVSTTAFRAAMQAGLQITSRRNHAYPVKYYGAPGYDATVYSPTTDFRFLNDTGKPIYLSTKVVGTRVVFEIWGVKDGRQVTINGPFVTDKKPDGSLTAAVAQIVKKGSKIIREQNFVSKYQSPDKFPKVVADNKG